MESVRSPCPYTLHSCVLSGPAGDLASPIYIPIFPVTMMNHCGAISLLRKKLHFQCKARFSPFPGWEIHTALIRDMSLASSVMQTWRKSCEPRANFGSIPFASRNNTGRDGRGSEKKKWKVIGNLFHRAAKRRRTRKKRPVYRAI